MASFLRRDGKFKVEKFLLFALRTTPRIFNTFSQAIYSIMENKCLNLCHYIDDFLMMLSLHSNTSTVANDFADIWSHLILQSDVGRIRKAWWLISWIWKSIYWQWKRAFLWTSIREQSTLSLVFSSRRRSLSTKSRSHSISSLSASYPSQLGRPFRRKLFNILGQKFHRLAHFIAAVKRDLRWWQLLLRQWHGISVIRPSRPMITAHINARGTKGIGGIWNTQAFFEAHQQAASIEAYQLERNICHVVHHISMGEWMDGTPRNSHVR